MVGGRAGFGTAVCACFALALPAGASASTASIETVGKTYQLVYEAGSGERNRATFSTNGLVITVVDPGAVIEPGNDCSSVTDHQVDCDLAGFQSVTASLKGGNDRAKITGSMLAGVYQGGGGRDTLIGSARLDDIDGGPGPDVIKGRGFPDAVRYFGRNQGVHVTLGDGKRNDGGAIDGKLRDKLVGIEWVLGTDAADVIAGNAAENTINSAGGRDVVRGLGGGDDFFVGDGRDRVFGGSGGDLIYPTEGRDRAFGGPGNDIFQAGSFGGNGADLFSGGGGNDLIYTGNGADRISLNGKADDGPCGDPACSFSDEGDNVVGIEQIDADWGNDLVIGSKRAELFIPSLGTDIIRARGGNDTIQVSPDGVVDVFNCGAGTDEIVGTPDATDQNVDCE